MWWWRREKTDLGIVIFEVTDACNQQCKFCYNYFKGEECYNAPAPPNYRMAHRTLRRLFRQANVGSVSMSGGEPMLLDKIHELVMQARFGDAAVNLLTNGTMLTDLDIDIFHYLGVGTIQIPLLADKPEVHDAITQLRGSWQRATFAARKVAQRGNNLLTPVLILSRMNIDHIETTIDMFAELGCRYMMVNRFNIGGLGKRNMQQLVLSHEQLRDAFRRVDIKAAEHGIKVHSGVCTPLCVLDPKQYPHISFTRCTTDLRSRPLTVNYRGDVRFCNHSPRVLGNIHKEHIADILARASSDGYFDSKPAKCATCEMWERCFGGCRAAAEQVYGTFGEADPILDI